MMEYPVTGMMSGTSLDGLDLAHCRFILKNGRWSYKILAAETLPYPAFWKEALASAQEKSGRDLFALHCLYGRYVGERALDFFQRHDIAGTGLLASHGHTVFHAPDQGYTFQLGHGPSMAAAAKCNVVNDFRSMDVALGGQGAPLVPLGDKLLFGEYDYCLNLGGFANISYESADGRRLAYDICPLNFVINRLVRNSQLPLPSGTSEALKKAGNRDFLSYDKDGWIARNGKTNPQLLKKLNNISFYHQSGPKSLGEEWVSLHIWPLLKEHDISLPDLLNTFYHHAATQIGNQLLPAPAKLLITGGGTYNHFFMECLQEHLHPAIDMIIPGRETIDFKEALIFGFLGLRCIRKEINCLSDVTGASHDSTGGSIHYFTG